MTSHTDLLQASQINEAFEALKLGCAVLAPSALGWTIVAMETPGGARAIDTLKGRPDGKPLGIIGLEEGFKEAFGGKTPPPLCGLKRTSTYCSDVCISFVSHKLVSDDTRSRFGRSNAVGPQGEIAFWFNAGPFCNKLAQLVWDEFNGRCLVATSANISGEGNPKCETYDLKAVDKSIRDGAGFILNVPHYTVPELDDDGRWLSAPMFDMDTLTFRRKGKHMKKVETVLSLFHGMDTDNSNSVSLDEFTAFAKTKVGEKIFFSDKGDAFSIQDIKDAFNSIDVDHSGEIDFYECYTFVEKRLEQKNESKSEQLSELFNTDSPVYTKEELRKYFLNIDDDDFEIMFQDMDKDRSGTIDFYELWNYQQKAMQKRPDKGQGINQSVILKDMGCTRRFSRWDDNYSEQKTRVTTGSDYPTKNHVEGSDNMGDDKFEDDPGEVSKKDEKRRSCCSCCCLFFK